MMYKTWSSHKTRMVHLPDKVLEHHRSSQRIVRAVRVSRWRTTSRGHCNSFIHVADEPTALAETHVGNTLSSWINPTVYTNSYTLILPDGNDLDSLHSLKPTHLPISTRGTKVRADWKYLKVFLTMTTDMEGVRQAASTFAAAAMGIHISPSRVCRRHVYSRRRSTFALQTATSVGTTR